MTKRFTLKADDGIYCNIFDKGVDIAEVHSEDAKGLVDLLNKLHEDNQNLRKCINTIYIISSRESVE